MGESKLKSDTKDSQKQEKVILGINIIQQLVSKIIDNPTQILSGLKQILFFYKLLPSEWKKKAFKIFERLWNKKRVVMSTSPDQAKSIYDVNFDDVQLNILFNNLPQVDQAILIQGKSMQDLINKGLHGNSDETKIDVDLRYGVRGLNIVNMFTTKDIYYLFDELPAKPIKSDYEKVFNDWASTYDSIAALISPLTLNSNPASVEKKIVSLASKSVKNYVLVNLSGQLDDCLKLLNLIMQLKEHKKLNYKDIKQEILDSGFCKSIRIRIIFK